MMGPAAFENCGRVPVQQFQTPCVGREYRGVVPDLRHDLCQAKRRVSDDDGGAGGQSGSEDVGAFALGLGRAMGQHFIQRVPAGDDVSDRKRSIHLNPAMTQAFRWDIGADALQFARPIGVDLIGPNRIEGPGIGEMKQKQRQIAAREHRGIEHGELNGGTGGAGWLFHVCDLIDQG